MIFSNDMRRVAENVGSVYDEWRRVARAVPDINGWLAWKKVGDREYLYRRLDRTGRGKSLGPRSPETEAMHRDYTERMAERKESAERLRALESRLGELVRQARAVRLPIVDGMPGSILRQMDLRGLFEENLMVVGTTAFAAYEMEAQARFASGLDATEDLDVTWRGAKVALGVGDAMHPSLIDALKAVDQTFTVNTERDFQARNQAGYEVDFLMAPSVAGHPPRGPLRPLVSEAQECLLRGTPVRQVVCDRYNHAALMVAPDPRWMVLHKGWLARSSNRKRLKVDKDEQQARALGRAVLDHMPHYPVDDAFRSDVGRELKPYLDEYLTS